MDAYYQEYSNYAQQYIGEGLYEPGVPWPLTNPTNQYLKLDESRVIELYTPLWCDVARQTRWIPDGVSLGLKMFPSSDAFHIMTPTTDPLVTKT